VKFVCDAHYMQANTVIHVVYVKVWIAHTHKHIHCAIHLIYRQPMALICIIYVQIQLLGAAVVQNHAKISKSHDSKICML